MTSERFKGKKELMYHCWFEDGRPCGEELEWPYGTESSPWPTASKGMEGPHSSASRNEFGRALQAPDENTAGRHLDFSLIPKQGTQPIGPDFRPTEL